MIKAFDLGKSKIYSLAGLMIGGALLLAVFDYQSSIANITFYDFFRQSSTQNLLLALLLIVPVVGGIVVGRSWARIAELSRALDEMAGDRERLVRARDAGWAKSAETQSLLDQESGLFVDNWDQLVTEKDKLREEAEVSSALLAAALAIGNLAGPKEVLATLTEALKAALFADACFMFAWDKEAGAFLSDQAPDIHLKSRTFPAIKRLKEERVPIALADATAGKVVPKKLVDQLGLRSALLIPCIKRDEVVAIAVAVYTKTAHTFSDRDLLIASGIVNPATIVMENSDLYQEIVANHAELKRLMTRLAVSQEDERRRFARDLHDGVIQNLSGIIFSLSRLAKALDENEESARKEISQIEEIVQETITDLRQVIYDLRPTILDSLGLVPTLEKHLETFGRKNDIETVYKPQIGERLNGVTETALFRLAQEALNNIKKHAEAKKVILNLKRDQGSVVMSVKDDGRGFDMDEAGKRMSQDSGFGLSGMKERVKSLSGEVEIVSKPGEGTTVNVIVPLAEGA